MYTVVKRITPSTIGKSTVTQKKKKSSDKAGSIIGIEQWEGDTQNYNTYVIYIEKVKKVIQTFDLI